MRAHRDDCGWLWTWAAVGAGLVLSFFVIFSVGPFLIPFATLVRGMAATRRPRPLTLVAGMLVALAGLTAAVVVSRWGLLATPLLTLALAVAGRLGAEVAGALTGAGLAPVLLGGPPAGLLLVAAGLAAVPLMRAPAGPRPQSRERANWRSSGCQLACPAVARRPPPPHR